MQLVRLGTTAVFKKGDLIKLNKFGQNLFKYVSGSVGLIASDKRLMYEYDFHAIPEKTEYFVFDIIVSGQLFTDVPSEFLERIANNEKDLE